VLADTDLSCRDNGVRGVVVPMTIALMKLYKCFIQLPQAFV